MRVSLKKLPIAKLASIFSAIFSIAAVQDNASKKIRFVMVKLIAPIIQTNPKTFVPLCVVLSLIFVALMELASTVKGNVMGNSIV